MKPNQKLKCVYITVEQMYPNHKQNLLSMFEEHFSEFGPIVKDEENSTIYLRLTNEELQEFLPQIISFENQNSGRSLWWEILIADTGAKLFMSNFKDSVAHSTLKYLAENEMTELVELFNDRVSAVKQLV